VRWQTEGYVVHIRHGYCNVSAEAVDLRRLDLWT
jgi:hypothetical protein